MLAAAAGTSASEEGGGGEVRVRRALVSVSDKTQVVELCQALRTHCPDVEILSTGGTAKQLAAAGVPITAVDAHTGSPEILSGRVKTLHPTIHGGLLAVRGNAEHEAELKEHGIAPIDLVVCNLYPFEAAVRRDAADAATVVENIDIGGPSMIRSAAKNHRSVAVLTDPAQYDEFVAALAAHGGATPFDLRRRLAAAAFRRTAQYDAAIEAWFHSLLQE